MNTHYYKRYEKLISSWKNQTIEGNYHETHHIVPKSMGGVDSPENLVKLTARQHYIAHWLLMLAYGGKDMTFAFISMCRGGRQFGRETKYNSRAYEMAKREWSRLLTGRRGIPASVEQKKRLSELRKGTIRVVKENGEEVFVTTEELSNNPNWRVWNKGKTLAYDKNGNKFWVDVSDPRIVEGEIVTSGKLQAQNNKGVKNAMFKGWYITPLGRFETSKKAEIAHGCKGDAIYSRCISLNEKPIHANAIKRSKDLSKENPKLFIGKTWKELGWGFEFI